MHEGSELNHAIMTVVRIPRSAACRRLRSNFRRNALQIIKAHQGRSAPLGQLHRAVLFEMLVHIESVIEQMRLVSCAFPQALKLRLLKVVQ